eukprot:TRINITY_DN24220_c0_g1_i1.p1 TRINITY_DN24220_c0_g1~~TRINITY_DN24220_c0_g1_i1.p1  ORF type:complete len:526 (+),score=-22.59 TRINITY_DN24220_c0_g1_i1:1-1578(+)
MDFNNVLASLTWEAALATMVACVVGFVVLCGLQGWKLRKLRAGLDRPKFQQPQGAHALRHDLVLCTRELHRIADDLWTSGTLSPSNERTLPVVLNSLVVATNQYLDTNRQAEILVTTQDLVRMEILSTLSVLLRGLPVRSLSVVQVSEVIRNISYFVVNHEAVLYQPGLLDGLILSLKHLDGDQSFTSAFIFNTLVYLSHQFNDQLVLIEDESLRNHVRDNSALVCRRIVRRALDLGFVEELMTVMQRPRAGILETDFSTLLQNICFSEPGYRIVAQPGFAAALIWRLQAAIRNDASEPLKHMILALYYTVCHQDSVDNRNAWLDFGIAEIIIPLLKEVNAPQFEYTARTAHDLATVPAEHQKQKLLTKHCLASVIAALGHRGLNYDTQCWLVGLLDYATEGNSLAVQRRRKWINELDDVFKVVKDVMSANPHAVIRGSKFFEHMSAEEIPAALLELIPNADLPDQWKCIMCFGDETGDDGDIIQICNAPNCSGRFRHRACFRSLKDWHCKLHPQDCTVAALFGV